MDATMIQVMLDLHNQARASVNPPAKTMPTMTWDSTIANFAIAYTAKCQGDGTLLNHNPNRNLASGEYVGENIYATSQKVTASNAASVLTEAVNYWVAEKSDYNYASNSCSGDCGHYTQVVWADSVRVGCALVTCSNQKYPSTVLCDYGPGGNYNGEKPYISA
jgi:pathogenesis-related protein 1